MGRRGPPPKPTVLRMRYGNPSKRPMNKREPKPRKATPRCPAWLRKEAKVVWKRMVPELRRMKVLTTADGEALASFCQAYVRWQEAEEFLAKHGPVYAVRDERGQVRYMQQFPQVSIARNLLMILKSFYQEFGMTPSARTRIEIPAEDDGDNILEELREMSRVAREGY